MGGGWRVPARDRRGGGERDRRARRPLAVRPLAVASAADRERIAAFAEDTKEKALSLRGSTDRRQAEEELRASSETLAAALVETAESDPEVEAQDVHQLREDLRRELARLATADIKASRTGSDRARGPK